MNKAISLNKSVEKRFWSEERNFQFSINTSDREFELLSKILFESEPLNKLCRYTLGLQVYHNTMHSEDVIKKRTYHALEKVDETYFREISGSQISKYHISTEFKEYVSYGDWCYNKPEWDFCKNERILIREIISPKGLVCAISKDVGIANKAIIIVISKSLSTKFMLGLLTCKLIRYYVNKVTEKGSQRLFPRVSLSTISNLPIRVPSKDQETQIINIVKKIIELKGTQPKEDTTILEAEVDQLVYELYGLTEEEIRIVEGGDKKQDR